MNQNLKHSLIWLVTGLIGIAFIISLDSCITIPANYTYFYKDMRVVVLDSESFEDKLKSLSLEIYKDCPNTNGFYEWSSKIAYIRARRFPKEQQETVEHEYRHYKGECHDYWAKEWYPCNYSKLYNPPVFEKEK